MKRFAHILLAIALGLLATTLVSQETDTGVTTAQEAIGQTIADEPLADAATPLYPLWEDVASSTEAAIDDPDSTRTELDELRGRIVGFRTEFSQARSANADRISTLQSQLDALGPVPETGVEAPAIAETRAELEARLEELRAPARVADAAFQRAEGIISEIDSIQRERQTRRLLASGPSPFDVRNIPIMLTDLQRMVSDLAIESIGFSKRLFSKSSRDRFPLILFLCVISITLIIKGSAWVRVGIERLRRIGGRGSGVWSFLFSLLRILVPLSGLILLVYAIRLTGALGDTMEDLLAVIPIIGILLLGFRWLAERLFARDEEEVLIRLPKDKRRSARFYMMVISILFALRFLIDALFNIENAEPATVAILSFPIVAAMGGVLAMLGRVLRHKIVDEGAPDEPSDEDTSIGLLRALRFSGSAMVVIGLAAPALAAFGFAEAGNALLYPAVLSFALLGLVLIFQRFLTDVYGLLTGQGAEVRDGLMAVFFWVVLILGALPLLALMWGTRREDLIELWTQFLQGFDIGGTRISPADFMAFAIIFSIGYGITRILQSTLKSSVLPKTKIDIGGQNAVVSGVGYIGIFLAALVAVTGAGIDLSSLAIVAGALSVGIGFGLRTIVENFVSGIILLVGRPVSEGDWIEVDGQMGYVRDISVRSTRIETFDRTDVILPNANLVSGTVTNYTRGNTVGRLIVSVGVAYGTDTRLVSRILKEIADAQPMVLARPEPTVVFANFGGDALEFEVRMFLRDVNWILSVKSDVNHAIAERFTKEGIEIPFAQRDIWLRNPEDLHARPVNASSDTPETRTATPPKPDLGDLDGDANT